MKNETKITHIKKLNPHCSKINLCFYQESIPAGIPSQVEGLSEEKLDLNELLIKNPSATFFLRVSGHSMNKAGIHNNDILIVDRSLVPADDRVIIVSVNDELRVKRLKYENEKILLVSESNPYSPIDITGEEFRIWGVVVNVLHEL
ncbi:MAG: hypothetical protein CK425_11270 [Parachlamydia sp.]|nr:MAG: hypothetical protein CK425_11270 [Parachlamydia sp.]